MSQLTGPGFQTPQCSVQLPAPRPLFPPLLCPAVGTDRLVSEPSLAAPCLASMPSEQQLLKPVLLSLGNTLESLGAPYLCLGLTSSDLYVIGLG